MAYISWSSDFSSFSFCPEKPDSGELRCPATALINLPNSSSVLFEYSVEIVCYWLSKSAKMRKMANLSDVSDICQTK